MALTRPLKEGSVTTYQQKVALGFKDILASEADGDHDTMYAAWNGALGGDLSGTLPNPTVVATAKSKWSDTGTTLTPTAAAYANKFILDNTGKLTLASDGDPLIRMGAGTVKCDISENSGQWIALVNHPWSPQDTTKASWATYLGRLDTDNWQILRRAANAGAGVVTTLLTLDNLGNLSLSGSGEERLVLGSATMKSRVVSSDAASFAGIMYNLNWNGSAFVRDDTSKSAINLYAQSQVGNQTLVLQYTSAAGAASSALTIDGASNLVIAGTIGQKASGTTWSNPSDPRLKQDVAPYAAGLAEISQLEPITYRLKAYPDGPLSYGFDAEKVRAVFPECVTETRMKLDPADEEETDGVLSFDMHPILVALVNAVRELAEKIP